MCLTVEVFKAISCIRSSQSAAAADTTDNVHTREGFRNNRWLGEQIILQK